MLTKLFLKEKIVNKVISINIRDIIPNPSQPRKNFNMIELENLACSIKENGIIHPIIIRRNLLGQLELVSGERRLRACKLIGFRTIPSILIETDSQQSATLSILENIQRENLSFFEEAKAISYLINEWNVTQEEAAYRLGKAQSTIANKLRLLKISNREQNMILKGNLSERHARTIVRIDNQKIRLKCINYIINENLNVQQTEEYINEIVYILDKESKMIETSQDEVDINIEVEEIKDKKLEILINNISNKKIKKIKNRIPIIKDIRLFLNSINKAIDTMKSAGIDAYSEKKETEKYVEYVVRIPI